MTGKTIVTRKLAAVLATAVAALALAGFANPAAAFAEPVLGISSSHQPANLHAGDYGVYELTVSNSGTSAATGAITVEFVLPTGLTVASVSVPEYAHVIKLWSCTTAGDSQSVKCTGPLIGDPGPGQQACEGAPLNTTCPITVVAKAAADVPPGTVLSPEVEACGGGATSCATATDPTEIEAPAPFGVAEFDGSVLQENGEPATQAGSHPWTASTNIVFPLKYDASGNYWPAEDVKNVAVDLPPGLVGNPNVVSTCTAAQIVGGNAVDECPADAEVGVIKIEMIFGSETRTTHVPVYNMNSLPGQAATFAFNISGSVVDLNFGIRSGTDYGIHTEVLNSPLTLPIGELELGFRGIPTDPGWNTLRGKCMNFEGLPNKNPNSFYECPDPSTLPVKPFLTLPTSCSGPQETDLRVTTWEGSDVGASFLSHDNTEPVPNPIGADGCNTLKFNPTLEARPTTNEADAPSGLSVDINVPQNVDPTGTATAHLRNAVVALPQGLIVNPAGANGLQSCSEAQAGVTSATGVEPVTFTPNPANCPDASKLGRVEIDTPLLTHPLLGSLYLATPHANPFGSLVALYLTVNDPQSGVVINLAGNVSLNQQTGQLTATFLENPQLPFEHLKINIFGGADAPLRTPDTCGSYSTTSSLTPWSAPESGPPATPRDTYGIINGPGGSASCPISNAGRPNSPSFDAGTEAPLAGANSPLVVNLRRQDGSQQFSSVTLTPPPGLVGKLAGVPYCPASALRAAEAKTGAQEQASPSCPPASEVGNVTVGAGAGPAPYYAPGKAYLSGPYKGAPLSLAIVTPAVAGPFDLGTVVVRAALWVDPTTTQITAVSDPIPTVLQGIKLDVRSIQVRLDRPEFTRNPTSCDAMAFGGQLVSILGQPAALSNRFQLAECGRLNFKPKIALRLKGGTKRTANPAFTAIVTMPGGNANIATAQVTLPRSEFLDQSHIGTVCTNVQFNANQCPVNSVYGFAKAETPLLEKPLEGPVYLRSSKHKLPDLVADLNGQIRVVLDGRIDSIKKGGIRNTFELVPDAPISRFVLQMKGGKKGLLENSTNICRTRPHARALFTGHNGAETELKPALKAKCRNKRHHRKKRRNHHRRATRRAAR